MISDQKNSPQWIAYDGKRRLLHCPWSGINYVAIGLESTVQDFRKLMVWNKAHKPVLDVYAITKPFPVAERYGLTTQLRRSAASIATNLAEGCGRASVPGMANFVQIAFASACESEYQLLLAKDLGYVPSPSYRTLSIQVTEVKRMLAALLRTLNTKAAVRGRG